MDKVDLMLVDANVQGEHEISSNLQKSGLILDKFLKNEEVDLTDLRAVLKKRLDGDSEEKIDSPDQMIFIFIRRLADLCLHDVEPFMLPK